jgi:citrate synthase
LLTPLSAPPAHKARPAGLHKWATPAYSISIRAPSSCADSPRSSPPRRATPTSELHRRVERIAPLVIAAQRWLYRGVSANIDFYSGFVYRMLDIPAELFTPLFAISRVVGWSAHRLEELTSGNKLIRPAYKSVSPLQDYVPIGAR